MRSSLWVWALLAMGVLGTQGACDSGNSYPAPPKVARSTDACMAICDQMVECSHSEGAIAQCREDCDLFVFSDECLSHYTDGACEEISAPFNGDRSCFESCSSPGSMTCAPSPIDTLSICDGGVLLVIDCAAGCTKQNMSFATCGTEYEGEYSDTPTCWCIEYTWQ